MVEEKSSLIGTDRSVAMLLVLPALVVFTLTLWLPLLWTLGLSFFSWNILTPAQYVGLANFVKLFKDPFFSRYLTNTLGLTAGTLVCIFFIPLLISLLANKAGAAARNRFTSAYFLPIALAIMPVSIYLIWRWMFNPDFGLVNFMLSKFGIRGIEWLNSAKWAKPAMNIVFFYQFMPVWIGLALIIYGAYWNGLKNKNYKPVTFRAVTFFFLIIALLSSLGFFEGAFVMTGGGPAGSTTTLFYYIYITTYQWFQMGYAATIAVLPILFSLFLGILVWRITERQSLKLVLLDENEKTGKATGNRWWLNVLLLLIAIITIVPAIIPFLWALSTALKQPGEVFTYPPRFIPQVFNWNNFSQAWKLVPMGHFYINSISKAIGTIALQIPIAFLAAYSISILKVPGRKVIFFLITSTMFVSSALIGIPFLVSIKELNLIDTRISLIIPFIAWGFAVFIFKIFLDGLQSKAAKAKIEGLSEGAIFKRLVLPRSRPMIFGISALSFFLNWGEMKWPLVVINKMFRKTLPIGQATFQGLYTTDWTILMASAILIAVPASIVFLAILFLLKKVLLNRLAIVRSDSLVNNVIKR